MALQIEKGINIEGTFDNFRISIGRCTTILQEGNKIITFYTKDLSKFILLLDGCFDEAVKEKILTIENASDGK